jgi:hypothetical protein
MIAFLCLHCCKTRDTVFFYSNENSEPIHVHVEKGSAAAKIWLEPKLKVAYFYGFSSSEEKAVFRIVESNFETFKIKVE